MSADQERKRRERALVRLVEEQVLGTQSELIQALESVGISATQATVSRDIKRLGLVKAPLPNGRYRYRNAQKLSPRPPAPAPASRLGYVQDVLEVESLLAVRTLPGRAMAVATTIDEMVIEGVSGTLAGDDTVLVMLSRAERREAVREQIESLS